MIKLKIVFVILVVAAVKVKAKRPPFTKTSQKVRPHDKDKAPVIAFASQSIPPPPPISVPVYSLAAPAFEKISPKEEETEAAINPTSMNIITFCTPVSVAPPKLWTISLYTNTMTKEYFFRSKVGILQLLDKRQSSLIPILGKRSGYESDYSKEVECEKVGFNWRTFGGDCSGNEEDEEDVFQSIKVIENCQSYIKFHILQTFDAGDHEVALCQVLGVSEWDDEANSIVDLQSDSIPQAKDEDVALYTGYLRKEGII